MATQTETPLQVLVHNIAVAMGQGEFGVPPEVPNGAVVGEYSFKIYHIPFETVEQWANHVYQLYTGDGVEQPLITCVQKEGYVHVEIVDRLTS